MERKHVTLTIKSADDATGTFTGLASVFDNLDAHGDIVRRGAFAKSLQSGEPIPLLWFHNSVDPRAFVGDVVSAAETAEGLEIVGKFDLDTDFGGAAYRNVKGRRVGGLSIGYSVRDSVKSAAGNELTDLELVEVSIVARGANPAALISSVKSVGGVPTAPIRARLARSAAERYLKEGPIVMSNAKLDVLVKDRQSQLADIQTILDTADKLKTDLSDEAAAEVAAGTEKIRALDTKIAQARHDLDVIRQAKAISDEVGMPAMDGGEPAPPSSGHLALSGKHAKTLAGRIVTAMPRDASGTKALSAGVQSTSMVVLPTVVATGRPATSILDLLPARTVPPLYSYLRQSARTWAAAPVAEGSSKPTTILSVQAIQNRLRVVANISEAIPRYTLADNDNLQQFVEDELVAALRRSLENEIISGDGTGEHFTGILSTSGIVSQAFVTDALTSIRAAITTLNVSGYEAAVIAVDAATWATIELQAATANAIAYQGVPINASERKLWGVPVALNQYLGPKVGLVLGEDAVTVDSDGQVDIRWSDAVGTDFQQNNIRALVETRAGVSINAPLGCVKVGTAA